MCTCSQNNTASLWSVSPISVSNGCGCCSRNTSTATASTSGGSSCGCAASANNYSNGGCFGSCSSASTYANGYTNQSSDAFVIRQVSGCSNCPYARSCRRCGCSW